MFYNARLYDPIVGIFVSADTVSPDAKNPASRNKYGYVLYNPIVYNDPSGHCVDNNCPGSPPSNDNLADRQSRIHCTTYACYVDKFRLYGIDFEKIGDFELSMLEDLAQALLDLRDAFGWSIDDFRDAMDTKDGRNLTVSRNDRLGMPGTDGNPSNDSLSQEGGRAGYTSPNGKSLVLNVKAMQEIAKHGAVGTSLSNLLKRTFVHELAHVWDNTHRNQFSSGMKGWVAVANPGEDISKVQGEYSGSWSLHEDWAEAVTAMVYAGTPQDYSQVFGSRTEWINNHPARASWVIMSALSVRR
jgi:hypothetical protein